MHSLFCAGDPWPLTTRIAVLLQGRPPCRSGRGELPCSADTRRSRVRRHSTLDQVALLTGLSSLPWMVKPLYGFISDSIPLFGYRRRSYLLACGFLGEQIVERIGFDVIFHFFVSGAFSWTMLAIWVDSPFGTVAAMLGASLSTAFSDVVVDSIVVERSRGAPQATSGSLQSLCWASSAVGGIASAYFSGSLVEEYGTRWE